MSTHTTRIRLSHTDAAGVVFFPRPLELVHAAYEDFLAAGGLGLAQILRERTFALPIVEATVKLQAPLHVGDDVVIALALERQGNTSFILAAQLTRAGTAVASTRTVHVCIDASGKPTPLPAALVSALGTLPAA